MTDDKLVIPGTRLFGPPRMPGGDVHSSNAVTERPESLTETYEVVIVSYYSRDQLEGLFETVRDDQRIVLVDNASGADRTQDLLGDRSRGRWIDGQNSGYARAANRGALSSTAEFVVFANPDTRPSPEMWDALVKDLQDDPSLGSVAAATLDSSGQIEIGVGGWEPTPRRVLVYATGLHRLFPHAGMVARPNIGDHVELGWITGACLAVRRDVFVRLGGFDERYFVYNEDMAFGRALREAHIGQRLRTDLLVPHHKGTSGGGYAMMAQQRGASMAQYLLDHNDPASAALMRTTLAAGMLARLVVAGCRGRGGIARQHAAYMKGLVTRRSPFLGGTTIDSEGDGAAGRIDREQ